MLSTSINTASIITLTLFHFLRTTSALQLNAMTPEGCYSSSGDLVYAQSYQYMSSGYCQPICVNLGKAVLGLTKGSDCWCGDLLPAANTQEDASQCSTPCDGFGNETCGSTTAWTVWLTGTNDNISNSGSDSSSTATNTPQTPTTPSPTSTGLAQSTISATPVVTTVPPSIITVGGSTIIRTIPGYTSTEVSLNQAAPATSTPSSKPTSGSTNTAGIAAGVVVGVVALAAIIGGAFVFLKRRRQAAEYNAHRRNASLSAFATEKSTGGTSDSRLDPGIMVQRPVSGGSVFADHQDYSRRILTVANPDS